MYTFPRAFFPVADFSDPGRECAGVGPNYSTELSLLLAWPETSIAHITCQERRTMAPLFGQFKFDRMQ